MYLNRLVTANTKVSTEQVKQLANMGGEFFICQPLAISEPIVFPSGHLAMASSEEDHIAGSPYYTSLKDAYLKETAAHKDTSKLLEEKKKMLQTVEHEKAKLNLDTSEEIKSLQKTLRMVQKEITRMRTSQQNEIARMEGKIERLEKENVGLKGEMKDLQKKVQDLEGNDITGVPYLQ